MAVGLGGHALHCHGPRARPAQCLRGMAYSGGRSLPQCPLLIGAKDERGQLLAARIRERRN